MSDITPWDSLYFYLDSPFVFSEFVVKVKTSIDLLSTLG